jgi:hypothetical protein
MPKKYPANSPQYIYIYIYIIFIKNKCNMERKHRMHGKIKPDDANTEKQSLDLLFLCFPIDTCKVLSRETGGITS